MQKSMRTRKKTPVTSSKDGINISFPKSWEEMDQEQLRLVLDIISRDPGNAEMKVKLLLRYNHIKVMYKTEDKWLCYVRLKWWKRTFFTITHWQMWWFIQQLDFLSDFANFHNHLETAAGGEAIDLLLHELPFGEYLNAEKYYQLYMASKEQQYLHKLGRILYRKKDGSMVEVEFTPGETIGILFWYSWVKTVFAGHFPEFFRKTDSDAEGEQDVAWAILASMNAQIRALTDGDVTKEKEILDIDCWRALTELNEKAREGRQIKEKLAQYGK